jgi:hypothetical protein
MPRTDLRSPTAFASYCQTGAVVFDAADPDRPGKIVKVRAEVSEVRFWVSLIGRVRS